VIGIAGEFPGAKSVKEFWSNLRGGVDSVRTITPEEYDDPHLLANSDAFV